MTFRDELAARLRRGCDAARVPGAAIALSRGGVRFSVGYGSGDDKRTFTGRSPVLVGCLAKPMTATLFAHLLARETDLTFDSAIGDCVAPPARDLLSGITLTHLLNHSHGLQDSYRTEVPRDSNGFIDAREIFTELRATERLFEPGRTYSYGSVGYWLVGACIERLASRSVRDELSSELLTPLGIADCLGGESFCPAFGGDATLNADAFVALAVHQFSNAPSLRELLSRTVAYPGWSATSRASPCGWVEFGDGWYGQNSVLGDHSAVVRFHPDKEIALAVTSHTRNSFKVMAAVFGDVLPELTRGNNKPRVLAPTETAGRDWSQYAGDYRAPAARIAVRVIPRSRQPLQLTVHARSGRPVVVHLRPAEHGVFFATPSTREIASIQFVTLEGGNAPLLWNGTHLWPRVRENGKAQVSAGHPVQVVGTCPAVNAAVIDSIP